MFSMRQIVTKAKPARGKGKTKKEVSSVVVNPNPTVQKKRKETIPVKLREEVWIKQMGRAFEGKCPTTWCTYTITVFDFESGHNIPESRGGPTTIENLVPICSRCNRSMGSQHTFDQWCQMYSSAQPPPPAEEPSQGRGRIARFFSCHIFSKAK
jgi:5-methylcytosine-specific restriction endonuclease McrA